MSQFYCYIHKRKDGTPFYVGKGSKYRAYSFTQRSNWHKNIVAKEGGKQNIIVEIYLAKNEQNAFFLEQLFIKGLSLFFTLCNLTEGGDGPSGAKRSLKTRQLLSDKLSGKNHPNFGKHLSEETKKKISFANIGRKHSELFKKGCAERSRGKTHILSEESKEKLRQANSAEKAGGAKLSWQEVIEIRDLYAHKIMSQRKLAKEYGICRTQVIRILRYYSWKC